MLDLHGCQIALATTGRLCNPRALPVCEEDPDRPLAADSRDHAPRSADMHLLVEHGTERTDPGPDDLLVAEERGFLLDSRRKQAG